MKNFKKLILWQRSMELAAEVAKLVSRFPHQERFTYRDQIVRCSILDTKILKTAFGYNEEVQKMLQTLLKK
jgi:hypothetical protein